MTSDGDLTELRTDWHEKSATLKQQYRRFGDDPRVQRLFSKVKVSNNTPVENQELVLSQLWKSLLIHTCLGTQH